MSHTKGPWYVDDRNPSDFGLTVSCDQEFRTTKYDVCHISGIGDQNVANARLIAAAPEMLEALKQIAEPLHFVDESSPTAVMKQATLYILRIRELAESAIAKAETVK